MNNRGRSSLGLCHAKYEVNNFINSFREADVIKFGWLDNFFNPKSDNAQRVMAINKPKIARVHIINGPGLNNARTQSHEITHKETTGSVVAKVLKGDAQFIKKFRGRLKHVKDVCNKAPKETLRLYISPWLEHAPIPKECFDILAGHCKEILPEALIVDNPLRGRAFQGYVRESHDINMNPSDIDIFDLDGVDMETIDLRKVLNRFSRILLCYIWGLGENGFKPKEGWKHPFERSNFSKEREHKLYHYYLRSDALSINAPLDNKDIAGLLDQNETDGWKKDFAWKQGEGKPHATCLFPSVFKKFNKVEIKKNGKTLDTGKLRGRYTEDGSNRLIYDFTKHVTSYPDNCVLVADRNVWVLEKPQYRID